MSIRYNQQVSTDGLILHLDPANPKCLSTTGTSCINMVSGEDVTGASGTPGTGTHTPNTANFPTYLNVYGGVFNFTGGRGMNVDEDLGQHSAFTIDMWYFKNSTGTQYFTDARNNGGQWFLSNYTNDNINYTDVATYNFDETYDAGNEEFINRWQHLVLTSDAAGTKMYIDGTERNLVLSGSVTENLGKNFRIGTRYTSDTQWTGFMGPIKIYNRVLSADEALQSYLALRRRYCPKEYVYTITAGQFTSAGVYIMTGYNTIIITGDSINNSNFDGINVDGIYYQQFLNTGTDRFFITLSGDTIERYPTLEFKIDGITEWTRTTGGTYISSSDYTSYAWVDPMTPNGIDLFQNGQSYTVRIKDPRF